MNTAAEKEAVYTEYKDKIRKYVFGKLQNKEDAEDLVGEIFLKVCEKYESYDSSRASISTWIYTIARNTVIDYFRSNRAFSELPDNLSDGGCMYDDILKKESLNALAKSLQKLDERSRSLIILRYYKGMTLKDISVKFGISYTYTKILHKSALKTLQKYLKI